MSIQFHDGKILFVGGAIAMDPACCCCCDCYDCSYPKDLAGTSITLTIVLVSCHFTGAGCTGAMTKYVSVGSDGAVTLNPDGDCDSPKWSATVGMTQWRDTSSNTPPAVCDCEVTGTFNGTFNKPISVEFDCETGTWSLTTTSIVYPYGPVTIAEIEGDCFGFEIEGPEAFPDLDCYFDVNEYVRYSICVTAVVNGADDCMAV